MSAAGSVVVEGVDHGPMARFEVVKADANTPTVVFQKLTDPDRPQTLRGIAKAWGVPAGRFEQWWMTEHADLDDAADRIWSKRYGHETIEIADGASAEDIAARKLQIRARQWFASRRDRSRFGDAAGSTTINVNSPGSLVNILSGMDVATSEPARPGDDARVIEHEEKDLI